MKTEGGDSGERYLGKLICETVIGSFTALWLSDWLVWAGLRSRPLNTHASLNTVSIIKCIYFYI